MREKPDIIADFRPSGNLDTAAARTLKATI
jgi:hypothetical protein